MYPGKITVRSFKDIIFHESFFRSFFLEFFISDLKFGDGDGPYHCRVKKSRCFTFVENKFRSGLTLVSSWDCFCQEDSGICHFNFHDLKGEDSNNKDDECIKSWFVAPMKTLEYWHRPRLGWANSNLDFAYCNHLFKSFYLSLY